MEKSFREQLNLVKNNGCSVCDINVAYSCDSIFNFDYTEEQFEKLCTAVLNAYLSAENVSTDELALAIEYFFQYFNISDENVEKLYNLNKWALIDAAINGWDFGEPWCEGWTGPEDCEGCDMTECNCYVDVTSVEEKIICACCQKDITNDLTISKYSSSDPFNGTEESYFCENCYNKFIQDLRGED